MSWTRIGHNAATNKTRWEYRADGVVKYEDVPPHFVPCSACQKNWVIEGPGQEFCIFCQNQIHLHGQHEEASQVQESTDAEEKRSSEKQQEDAAAEATKEEASQEQLPREDDEDTVRVSL